MSNMVSDMLFRMQRGNVMKIEGICASRRKKAYPSDRSHRFWGAAGFSLTELLISLFALFIVSTFLASLSTKAIVIIASGGCVFALGWYIIQTPTTDDSWLGFLTSILFGLAIMALGGWVIFRGLAG